MREIANKILFKNVPLKIEAAFKDLDKYAEKSECFFNTHM